jgi:hypothetical protein
MVVSEAVEVAVALDLLMRSELLDFFMGVTFPL